MSMLLSWAQEQVRSQSLYSAQSSAPLTASLLCEEKCEMSGFLCGRCLSAVEITSQTLALPWCHDVDVFGRASSSGMLGVAVGEQGSGTGVTRAHSCPEQVLWG